MTRSPNPGNQRLRLLLLNRTSIALGAILLAGIMGGAWWTWNFVNKQLAPLVEDNLQQLLGRPVQVGKVQDFSLNGLRFGSSSLPATATDPDTLKAKAVEVQFDPLQILLNRTLKLNVTLVQPQVYIEQDQKGVWVATEIKAGEEGTGFIQTELESIRIQNGNVVLQAASTPKQPKASVNIAQVNGDARLLDQNQRINYTVKGQSTRGGNLQLAGETHLPTQKTNLKINTDNFLASDVTRLIELPLDLQGGRVNGDLTVQFQLNQPEDIALFGTVGLNQVTAQINGVPRAFNNSTGNLQFQDQNIALENVNTRYGSIPVQAKGSLNLQTGYNLTADVKAASFKNLLETFNLKVPVPTAGTAQANLQLQGGIEQPILTGTASTIQAAQIDRVNFSKISTRLRLTPAELVFSNIQATPTIGGNITGSGRIGLETQDKIAFNLQAENVSGDALAKTYNASPQFTIGNLSANAQVSGTAENFQTVVQLQAPAATYPGSTELVISDEGNVQFRDAAFKVAGGTVTGTGQLVKENWQASVNANSIQLTRFPEVPPQYKGVLNGNLNLSGTTASFQPSAIQGTGQGTVKLAQGTVNVNDIRLNNGRWQAVANASGIPFNQFTENIPGQVVNTNLRLAGTTESFELADIQASGQANLQVADGTINLSNISLNNGRWQTLANISQVQLNTFSEQLNGRLGGNVQLAGTTASFQPSNIQAAGQVRFSQALPQLQQPLTAQFQWNGEQLQIVQASTAGLRAAGTVDVEFEETQTPEITALNLDIRAQDYNLQNLPFTLPGNIELAGNVDFTGQVRGTPATPIASGNIQLRNFAVNDLAFEPVLTGQVNYQPEQGTQLKLTGKQDQIAFTLGENYRPTSFLIQRDRSVASGRTEGDNLLVNVKAFPVALLESFLPADANLKPLAGELSGNLAINLTDFNLVGDVAIAQPRIGRITADRFRGRIGFADGTASLQQGELIQGQSRYLLSGELPTTGEKPLQFQISFDQARIENALQALGIFGFEDLATGFQPDDAGAEVLDTQPVSLPDAPLLAQLEFFEKIQNRLAQQRAQQQQEQARIPSLAELSGIVNGQIAVTGSLQTGINANFNLTGSNWVWGDYNIPQVVAQGNFENGVVTLVPLRVNVDGSLLAFTGQLGEDQLSGQARVESLPVGLVERFLPEMPVDIAGQLNALVTLAGSLENPTAIGEIGLANGSINNQSVEAARVSFNYNNARFNFGSTVLAEGTGTEPVAITGSIPFALPFASVKPDSNQITLNANVENDGLAVLNLFTNQVNWVSGQGQVNVEVEGTLDQPTVNGIATVNNAVLKVQNLPEQLTNVRGTVRFAGDRFIVDNLQGQYSRGQLTAAGILPIFANQNALQEAAANPLTVASENLRLNLPELYQGDVSGNVVITGTAQNPNIGGEIRLRNGEIALRDDTDTTAASPSSTDVVTPPPSSTNVETSPSTPVFSSPPSTRSSTPANTQNQTAVNLPIEFTDLRVILENDVSVTRQPLFSFVAQGDINLNGTLTEPRPQGVINLQRGQVDLFVTQFNLARGFEQTATFTPRGGFDPILDVRLVAFVPEVTGSRLPTASGSSEIADVSAINFGTLNTVRIEAAAQGPASQLSENLELTSEPARSEAEIVALLGGSFLNLLAQTDTTQLGLGVAASLAGSSGVFSDLQAGISQLGQAIGLRELRIFPTVVNNPASNVSVLGLAAEAAVGISDNFSFSLSRVFSANEPFRYNFLYRVNDQILLRGSTNLSDDSRAIIQYETRF